MFGCNNLVWDRSRPSFPGRAARGDAAPVAQLELDPWMASTPFLWCSLEMVLTMEQGLEHSG